MYTFYSIYDKARSSGRRIYTDDEINKDEELMERMMQEKRWYFYCSCCFHICK